MWAEVPPLELRREEGDDTRYTYFATTLRGSLVDLTPFGNALPTEDEFILWAEAEALERGTRPEPQGHGFVTGSTMRMEPREIEATDPFDLVENLRGFEPSVPGTTVDPIGGGPLDPPEAQQPTGRRMLDVGD